MPGRRGRSLEWRDVVNSKGIGCKFMNNPVTSRIRSGNLVAGYVIFLYLCARIIRIDLYGLFVLYTDASLCGFCRERRSAWLRLIIIVIRIRLWL